MRSRLSMPSPSLISPGVFIALICARNRQALSFWWATPHVFSGQSLLLILRFGVLPIAMAAGLGLAAWGIGRRLLAALLGSKRRALSPLLFHLTAYALGIGLIAYSIFLLGLFRALHGPWLFLFGASLLPFAGVEGYRCFPAVIERFRANNFRPPTPGKAFLAGLLAYAAWHAVIAALAPPTAFDVLTYHLALPKIFLREGRIIELPWLLNSHWPHLLQCLYVLPLWFGMDNVPALLHALGSAALVLAVFGVAREFLQDSAAAWIAATLLATQPTVLYFAGTAQVDAAFALFFLLSSIFVWMWRQDGDRRWLVVGGVLSGLTAAAKLQGLALFALLTLWIWLRAARSRDRSRWEEPGIFLACGLCLVAPWYLKTWIWTGNPIWPFYSRFLGGKWEAAALERTIRGNYWLQSPNLALLLQHGPQYLVLPAGALAAAGLRRRWRWPSLLTKFLLPISIPYFLIVVRSDPYWRYMLPFFPAFVLAAGFAASRLIRASMSGRIFAVCTLAFGLFPIQTMNQSSRLMAVLGWTPPSSKKDPRTFYLEQNLDHYRIYQAANRMLEPSAKVLLFQEIRGYYLDRDYEWGDPILQTLIPYASMRTSEELRARLTKLGITHIFINAGDPLFFESPWGYTHRTIGLMRDFLTRHGKLILRDGPMLLFSLTQENGNGP